MSPSLYRWFLALSCALLVSVGTSHAHNPPPTQVFYVPFPEDNQLEGFRGVNTAAVDPLAIFVTFSAATDGTVIYYDHWEDGYERDITNPVQSTTLVFGDGNPANGYPPGNAGDLIPAGTVFSLRNYVQSTTLQAVLDYDARDKVASYKPISLTKTSFPASTNTLLAGCLEVFEQGLWGTEYRVPVGENMPTSTATTTLASDADIFAYTSLSIMAGAKGATVQIDADNSGSFEQTVALGEGQTSYVTGVNVGARVQSNRPVQVAMFSGRPTSNYQSRDTMLLPTYRWSTSYYAPVSTSATNGTTVFLYNPGTSAITVSYDYRSSVSAYTTATISVPAGGNARVNLAPANGTSHFGAYRFYTTGATPPAFYAFSAVDSTSTTTGNNQAYDGGYTLVGQPSLTTQVLVSLGIGRDPYSATNPAENGNPVWITTAGNGHTPVTVYVDYDGDNAGPLTDANGNQYDVSYNLRELEQQQILDPDGDQSGMLVYSLDPSVRIAAAWAQNPTLATAGQPGLDVSTLIPPLREGEGGKMSRLDQDADGDGHVSAGDTLEYELRAVNSARSAIPGPFAVQDTLPVDVHYVPGSTRYRFTVGGAWQAWASIPDDVSGSPFPLDGAGFSVPGDLGTGQQFQVTFKATIKDYGQLSGASITNQGTVEISPYGLLLPIEWTDTIYGSIGDRVWNDLNGNFSQDGGEPGIPGIRVFADLNNNGQRDAGEPQSVTDSNGYYELGGLTAGTYVIRVNPVDIAAANVGFGPTYDLDGIATSNVATLTLAGAQDRVDADFGYRIGASVGDRVWLDRDADGVQENGEPGISGVRTYIDLNNNNAYDAGEPDAITGTDGIYYIGNLNPGTYAVRVDASTLPAGATQTFDLNGLLDHEASVTLLSTEHRGDLDFGYRGTLSIGNEVWEDVDGNGLLVDVIVSGTNGGMLDMNRDGAITAADTGVLGGYDVLSGRLDTNDDGVTDGNDDITTNTFLGLYRVFNGRVDINLSNSVTTDDVGRLSGEFGIPNIRLYIDTDGDGLFGANEPSAITNASGLYSIGNLFDGTYTVRVDTSTLPASFVQTYDLTNPATDHTATVTLAGTSRTDVDFGYRNDATVGDLVWNDRNNNGVREPGEPGIEGVLVYIDADSDNLFDQGVERFAITNVDGVYRIDNLPSGSYNVRVEISTLPQGASQTYDLNGVLDHEAARALAVSEDAADVDFGYRASAAFGDFVWNDLNANGVQDSGELGISGVRVYADINGNGAFDAASEPSGTTDSNGLYSIGNLVPGTYTARIDTSTLPAGMVQTFDATGTLDHAATFFVSATQTRTDIDFGYTLPATIGDLVWNDANVNGQQDGGESGIDGVTVTVFHASNDTIAATTTTASGGAYAFNLMPGSYYLVFDTPAGFIPTPADQGSDNSDSDAAVSNGRTANLSLLGGQSNLTIDAGFYQPGTVSGHLYIDTNGNGTQDPGEPDLANVNVLVTNSLGNVQTVSTDGNGDWTATVPPGSTTANVDETDPDYPAGYTQTEGTDPTTVTAIAGSNTHAGIDGYAPPVDLGIVKSVNQATPLVGSDVTFTLVATNHGPGPATGVIVNDVLPTGYTFVSAHPPTAYHSGTGVWTIGSLAKDATATLTITATVEPSGNHLNVASIRGDQPDPEPDNDTDDAITYPIQLGAITGTVWEDTDNNNLGDTPIEGVILSLVDGSGNPVLDENNQPVTTTTAANGTYSFGQLPPGTYGVIETQPAGLASLSDKDGGDLDEIRPITVTAGQTNTGNDFVEISRCPDTWADWKQLHPGELAAGNPDADSYDNFAEFAFAMPYDNGTGSPWLGHTAWVIRPSTLALGTLEGVFIRPKGAPLNVTYTLQYTATPANPTVWQEIVLTSLMFTTTDNGDCTETVTIHDLENLTGLTAGKGVVRIKADLDDDGGNDEVDHTSFSEPEGWTETPLELCCRTYNNPYLRESVFTGIVGSVSGQTITFSVSGGTADLATVIGSGTHFIEVTSGDLEGHRFDIASVAGNTLTLGSDSVLDSFAAPFNTLAGAPPVTLAGDTVAIRRHWTLDELFPSDGFLATGSQASADQVQVFAGGTWKIFWLYDENDANPATSRWVDAAESGMADQGGTLIPPGQGLFFNNRGALTSILAYGEVRTNDFIRPLATGNSLVGGGFPVDQSATGAASRQMTPAAGFAGTRDFKTADSFFLWNADEVASAKGYATYYLLNGAPVLPWLLNWAKVGDNTAASRDAELLFLGNRAVFVRSTGGQPGYTIPVPWQP